MLFFFFFKQKTAYEIGLGIPAEPLFRSAWKDQVYAQNEMLAYQQKESTARVASIMENTNLSKQQQVSEIMRQMLTQAQTRSEERRVGKSVEIGGRRIIKQTKIKKYKNK